MAMKTGTHTQVPVPMTTLDILFLVYFLFAYQLAICSPTLGA